MMLFLSFEFIFRVSIIIQGIYYKLRTGRPIWAGYRPVTGFKISYCCNSTSKYDKMTPVLRSIGINYSNTNDKMSGNNA